MNKFSEKGKKRFSEAKHFTKKAFRKVRQIRKGKTSLQRKLLYILIGFALIITTSFVINVYVRCDSVFDSYFENQLQERTHSIIDGLRSEAKRADIAINTMVDNDTAFATLVEKHHFSGLSQKLERLCRYSGSRAYLLLGEDYNIVGTNITGRKFKDIYELQSIARIMEKGNGIFADMTKMIAGELAVVGGKTLRDSNGQMVGTAFLIVHWLTENEYLDALKKRHLTDITIFEDDKRVATTMFDTDGERMVGTKLNNKEALESVYKHGMPYSGKTYIGGHCMFVHYMPTTDSSNNINGIFYAGVDANISGHLKWLIIISMTIVGLFISAMLTFGTFIYVRKSITRPIRSLAASARQIAEKDISQKVYACHSEDELQELSESMREMQLSLSDTISEVMHTANILRQSSEEMSRASTELSEGANKQAASLEEIASSLNDVKTNINANTDSSLRAKSLIETTNDNVAVMANKSEECMTANKNIAGAIRNINKLVNQTNILSLNASVEAARAGSAGRGFAVVAKEVGRLAEQTKTTAANVSATTQNSIDGNNAINNELNIVTPQLAEMVALMKEITTNSIEQRTSTEQIVATMNGLNKSTQTAAANAEEIAANAEELNAAAEHLHNLIKGFKVSRTEEREE
ncbi:MAG: methyl-accepting chemotaxis protein [Bacteroidales bacterium]|nr:methyl-accepting chemotaxis protein [Bacteroidales bacterium]